jgi:hypothetical protein
MKNLSSDLIRFSYTPSSLSMLPQRRERSNKGDYGRVLCICGSKGMSGAAYLCAKAGHPYIRICSICKELIHSLPALLCDSERKEDASDKPHRITHAPEALRYAVMSRTLPASATGDRERWEFIKSFGQAESSESFFD